MPVLKQKVTVRFDPHNKEHIEAVMLTLTEGKLHPTLRFDIEGSFLNAIDMAKHIMAVEFGAIILGKEYPDAREKDKLAATEEDLESATQLTEVSPETINPTVSPIQTSPKQISSKFRHKGNATRLRLVDNLLVN